MYIIARQHSAETHGSLVMSNIIKDLSSNFKKYESLMDHNIIKLIPMVNPDGVVIGNSRSSLAGVDLNRRWSNPSK
jgi:murein tripeptide amidase MpaA